MPLHRDVAGLDEGIYRTMTPKYESIHATESDNHLTIHYSRSSRIDLAVAFVLIAAALGIVSGFSYLRRTILLTEDWFVLPICLFGAASLVLFLFRTGMLKSPLRIDSDGLVRHGMWSWQFPGPMRAAPFKVSGKNPRYLLALRYGATELRYPAGDTEGSTIAIAAKANLWIAERIHGQPDTPDSNKGLPAANWAMRLSIFVLFFTPVLEAIASGSGYYLDDRVAYGTWAQRAALVFTALTAALLGQRLLQTYVSEVKAGSAVWMTEILVASLMTLGAVAIIAHEAQRFELIGTSMTPTLIDQPLVLTRTTTGKGCHRFLILREPSLGETVQYCDPRSIRYWDGAIGVRVRQSGNAFGIHVEAVERISVP